MKRTKKCSECGGREIYKQKIDAGGGYAPDMLPGVHPWWRSAKMEVYVCRACGHYRFFVPEEYLSKIPQSKFEKYS